METRLERNKRLRKNRRIKRIKSFIILVTIILLIFGIKKVNQTIVDLNCIDNTNIVGFNYKTKELDFFGKSYIIHLKEIKNLLKDQFSGLLVLHNRFYLL